MDFSALPPEFETSKPRTDACAIGTETVKDAAGAGAIGTFAVDGGTTGAMGQAASLGSLSVPPAWTSAIRVTHRTGASSVVQGPTTIGMANLPPDAAVRKFHLDVHAATAAASGKGSLTPAEGTELARLRSLVAAQDRYITALKRALAYFAACQLQ